MAEEVRRQVVTDPLAQKAGGQTPDRSLSLGGMRRPATGPGTGAVEGAMQGLSALTGIRAAVAGVLAAKKDEWMVEGKMDYMTGVTEEEMLRTGNKYTQQGYETLSAVDQASSWYQNELLAIDETARDMSPQEYKSYLMDKRRQALSNLPNDPAVRKIYVAAFEEYGPRLATAQFEAHNGRNRENSINSFSDALYSSSGANEDASRVMPGGPLRVSPGIVSPKIEYSAEDRDIGIRTMLGEAGGEGELGMAAVAHVLKNRAIDGGYGGSSIRAVSLEPKQFSAWNKGPGGIPAIRNYNPNSKAYQRAAKVYDAVMQGHHADPTGGATHYFSPMGMKLLVKQGSQKNLVPGWWSKQAALNEVTIGNHRFAGRARNLSGFKPVTGAAPTHTAGAAVQPRAGMLGDENALSTRELGPVQELAVVDMDDPAAVAAAEGVPLTHTPGTSQARELAENTNMRDEDKAIGATQAMIRQLEEGNDQLYNDLGGEAYLRSVGATPAQINAVQAAKTKQQKAQQDRFSVDTERRVEDFRSAIKAGAFDTVEDVLRQVDSLQEELGQDEAWAKSLANETLTEWHKFTDDDKALNPQLEADLAGIRRKMQEEGEEVYTAEMAVNEALELGEKYDIDGKVVNGWVQDMLRRDQTRRDKLRTEMKTLKDKQDKEDKIIAQVDTALKLDSGLASVKGNVTAVKNGHEVEVSAQEYGIQLLRNKEIENARSLIDQGKLDPQRAEAIVNKNVYEKLAKHGVVDEEHGRELIGALKGDFVGKDGTVNEGAAKAFDFWLQLKNNPNVGADYMARMVPDEGVRTLLNTAELMYSGRLDIEQALRKASLRISQGADLDAKIVYNEKFSKEVGAGVDEAMADALRDPWFKFDSFTQTERDQVMARRGKYREEIEFRANGYHIQNPMVDPSVHIKMAIEDFKNDSIALGGNLLVGKYTEGKRLDQVMGIDDFGKDAPQRALTQYMATFDKDLFPNLIDDWDRLVWTGTVPYHAEYNPDMGTLEIQLWKDSNRTEFVGSPVILDVAAVGAWWKETNMVPGVGSRVTRTIKEHIVNTLSGNAALLEQELASPE